MTRPIVGFCAVEESALVSNRASDDCRMRLPSSASLVQAPPCANAQHHVQLYETAPTEPGPAQPVGDKTRHENRSTRRALPEALQDSARNNIERSSDRRQRPAAVSQRECVLLLREA